MEKQRFTLRADVQLLLIKEKRILLLLRQNTGYQDGNYGLIAGHVEAGETITAAMSREAKEEAGLELTEKDLKFNQVMQRKSTNGYITFFFEAPNYQGPEPVNLEPEKCVELKWFDLNGLPQNIIPFVKSGIENYQKNNNYSEFIEI
jgi:ADP-ribose pyrophosphatase YjhB (NUDIX family)